LVRQSRESIYAASKGLATETVRRTITWLMPEPVSVVNICCSRRRADARIRFDKEGNLLFRSAGVLL